MQQDGGSAGGGGGPGGGVATIPWAAIVRTPRNAAAEGVVKDVLLRGLEEWGSFRSLLRRVARAPALTPDPLADESAWAPQPAPEVAAALAAGFLPSLELLVRQSTILPALAAVLDATTDDFRRPGMLRAVLAYGEAGAAAALLASGAKALRAGAEVESTTETNALAAVRVARRVLMGLLLWPTPAISAAAQEPADSTGGTDGGHGERMLAASAAAPTTTTSAANATAGDAGAGAAAVATAGAAAASAAVGAGADDTACEDGAVAGAAGRPAAENSGGAADTGRSVRLGSVPAAAPRLPPARQLGLLASFALATWLPLLVDLAIRCNPEKPVRGTVGERRATGVARSVASSAVLAWVPTIAVACVTHQPEAGAGLETAAAAAGAGGARDTNAGGTAAAETAAAAPDGTHATATAAPAASATEAAETEAEVESRRSWRQLLFKRARVGTLLATRVQFLETSRRLMPLTLPEIEPLVESLMWLMVTCPDALRQSLGSPGFINTML